MHCKSENCNRANCEKTNHHALSHFSSHRLILAFIVYSKQLQSVLSQPLADSCLLAAQQILYAAADLPPSSPQNSIYATVSSRRINEWCSTRYTVGWLGIAAPIPAPPIKPATARMPMTIPLPKSQEVNELLGLEHLVAVAPIPAPAAPRMNALRRRWLSSNKVTRITSPLLTPTSLSPSRSCIASPVTVENVPLCVLRSVSTTSILWPACKKASGVSSKAANWGQFKTGQRKRPELLELVPDR